MTLHAGFELHGATQLKSVLSYDVAELSRYLDLLLTSRVGDFNRRPGDGEYLAGEIFLARVLSILSCM